MSSEPPHPFSTSPTHPHARPFHGAVDNTVDALRLVAAARRGVIPRVLRRLNDVERRALVVSGAVFVFAVGESRIKRWTDGRVWSPSRIDGNFLSRIKRWTDGRVWSPSRIDGNFLVYRELNEKNGGPTTADRFEEWRPEDGQAWAAKGKGRGARATAGEAASPGGTSRSTKASSSATDGGYKTITVTVNGEDHHLIVYYSQADFDADRLPPLASRPDIFNQSLEVAIFNFGTLRLPPRVEVGADGVQRIVCEPETMQDVVPDAAPPWRPTLKIDTVAAPPSPRARTRILIPELPALSPRWHPHPSPSPTHLAVHPHRTSTSPIHHISVAALSSPPTPVHAGQEPVWFDYEPRASASGPASPYAPAWSPVYAHAHAPPMHAHYGEPASAASSSLDGYAHHEHGAWGEVAGHNAHPGHDQNAHSVQHPHHWPRYEAAGGDWHVPEAGAEAAPAMQQPQPQDRAYASTSTQEWAAAAEYHGGAGQPYYTFGHAQYDDECKPGDRLGHGH
ncbi:hypothetical protein HWV62_18038 [Athelia sp. TMB]|nr:hypothetical protein HWV62_18038 [Athelia sp. TMB]